MELAILVVLVIVVASVLPVWVGAKMVGAERSGFFTSALAVVLSAILQALGTLVPVIGNIVAFLLVSWGFSKVLMTGFIKGMIVHAIQLVFWVALGIVASVVFGVAILGVLMA